MWTAANRKSYERKGLRYPSDMTDAEWALVKPLVDVPRRGQGRRRRVDVREVLNAVFYILETGCQWRALPRDLPQRSMVHDYFIRWQCERTLVKLHHELYVQVREQAGKQASPTMAIVDSQSIKSAERGAEHRIRWAGGLGCRQEDQRAQAPCGRRYARPDAGRGDPAGQHSGVGFGDIVSLSGLQSYPASRKPIALRLMMWLWLWSCGRRMPSIRSPAIQRLPRNRWMQGLVSAGSAFTSSSATPAWSAAAVAYPGRRCGSGGAGTRPVALRD